jgi:hypothetical protein
MVVPVGGGGVGGDMSAYLFLYFAGVGLLLFSWMKLTTLGWSLSSSTFYTAEFVDRYYLSLVLS